MKQRVSMALNKSRVILYLATMILCGIGAYIIFYYIPWLKFNTIDQVKALYLQQDFSAAIKLCNSYINKYPNEPEGYLWLGRNYDGRTREFNRQSQLRGRYLQNAKNPYFAKLQRKKFAEDFSKITVLLKKQGDKNFSEQALKYYRKAFELSPIWNIGIEIVESHIEAGRIVNASEVIAKISPESDQEKAHHALVKANLYYALEKQGKIELQAFFKQCEKSIDLYGRIPERERSKKLEISCAHVYWYLAKIAEKGKKIEQARKNYRKAISIFKKQKRQQLVAVYLNFALFLHQQGQDIEAKKLLLRARALNPLNALISYELARTSLILWQLPQAFGFLNEAFYLEKNNPQLPLYQRALSDKLWKKYRVYPDFQMIMGWPQQCSVPVEIQQELREVIYFIYKGDINTANSHFQSLFARKDIYCVSLLSLYCDLARKSIVLGAMKHWSDEKVLLVAGVVCKSLRQAWQNRYIKPDLIKCDEKIKQDLSVVRAKSPTLLSELYIAHCYFSFSFLQSQRKSIVFFPESVELIEKALAKFTRIQDNKALSMLYYFKGFSHRRLNQEKQALQALKRSIELAPSEPFFRLAYAETLTKAKKIQQAAVELEKITEDNDAPVLHYQVATEYMAVSLYQQARIHLQRCVSLSPTNYVARYFLAKTYLREGDHKQAIVTLESAYKNEGDAKRLNKMYLDDPDWEAIKKPELKEKLRHIWRTYQ